MRPTRWPSSCTLRGPASTGWRSPSTGRFYDSPPTPTPWEAALAYYRSGGHRDRQPPWSVAAQNRESRSSRGALGDAISNGGWPPVSGRLAYDANITTVPPIETRPGSTRTWSCARADRRPAVRGNGKYNQHGRYPGRARCNNRTHRSPSPASEPAHHRLRSGAIGFNYSAGSASA
jgi:hypothetical protein